LYRMTTIAPTEPSLYMQELTRYLSANMNSVLLGLPTEIKELIYFDALSHAATMILVSFTNHVNCLLFSRSLLIFPTSLFLLILPSKESLPVLPHSSIATLSSLQTLYLRSTIRFSVKTSTNLFKPSR